MGIDKTEVPFEALLGELKRLRKHWIGLIFMDGIMCVLNALVVLIHSYLLFVSDYFLLPLICFLAHLFLVQKTASCFKKDIHLLSRYDSDISHIQDIIEGIKKGELKVAIKDQNE